MESFEHKTLVTKPLDLTYSYYISPNFHAKSKANAPTLLFCHGYPDDAWMWAGAVPTLLKLPYRMILIDILGFGGSSKPKDPQPYAYKQQADSIAQILDQEGVEGKCVIPIGHDWGSATVQRFYLYHRHRCVGLCLISLAYQVPSEEKFDLVKANEATEKRFGYPQWEYWNFFIRPDAPKLMHENIERFLEVNNGVFPSPKTEEGGRDIWMREMFCVPKAMDEYVTKSGRYKDFTVELKPYAKEEKFRKAFIDRLSRDGFEGPVNYYHSLAQNCNLEDERTHLASNEAKTIDVPVLYIGQTGDWVCRTDLMGDAKAAGLLKAGVEEKVVEAGHWVLYEKPEEIAELIAEWLGRKFPAEG
jgi:soluble epoxide hydrolase / lipid-phosphate phosphatase